MGIIWIREYQVDVIFLLLWRWNLYFFYRSLLLFLPGNFFLLSLYASKFINQFAHRFNFVEFREEETFHDRWRLIDELKISSHDDLDLDRGRIENWIHRINRAFPSINVVRQTVNDIDLHPSVRATVSDWFPGENAHRWIRRIYSKTSFN